ncbi:procollagen-lysine,2-oxoglutarate 5-dioxygenase 1-like [Asterias rubens]|uniref:procollagen-lysine,2-oxoglutarate 5-dioxygenase 1-like n=1 Tax=Asterias rubens TaxID=7604 RepID=UPI001455BA46|nr:procollagen-lysine,2-oxoglutarate 5-dioxygenase 1-like [Asterias rubens]
MASECNKITCLLRIVAILYAISLVFCLTWASDSNVKDKKRLLVVTVATNATDGFNRYMRSAKKNGLNVKVVGMHQQWKGGDILHHPGGGQKVNLLKEAVKEYKDDKDLVIMFTDSYDVILTSDEEEILRKFKGMDRNLVFSAEPYLWPDRSLEKEYPQVASGYYFLCSGMYIGNAPYFWKALTWRDIGDSGDDQLFFTYLFLDKNKRNSWKIALDNKAVLFQNMNGAAGDVVIKFNNNKSSIFNSKYETFPSMIHGNGRSKTLLNNYGNYLVDQWVPIKGCVSCEEDTFSLENVMEDDLPQVLVALFIEIPTPFIDDFFEYFEALDYPKKKIDLFIHNKERHHMNATAEFVEKARGMYKSVKYYPSTKNLSEAQGRNKGLQHCDDLKCDYYFSCDSAVRLTNPKTLQLLIEQNRSVIAPLVRREGKLWSNFWGDVNREGYYARSEDYIEIVKDQKVGVWNVAFISSIYLIHGNRLHAPHTPSFERDDIDPDMAFCQDLREKGIFMHITNRETFGYLVVTEYCETEHLHNDLWEIWSNRMDWERKYIHPGYYDALDPDTEVKQACTDVYTFPMFTNLFTDQLIEEMEFFGQWSSGQNEDERIAGGYENVPTRDIHMRQIDFEKHFLFFLREFIKPISEKVYPGYDTRSNAIMNFVVRYRPDEQPLLRPHHDSSTYTINVALNTRGVDYEGGGARFIRYNCSVIGLPKGHLLLHPGRLTHYHEGLRTTNGTRYILVSFIDP